MAREKKNGLGGFLKEKRTLKGVTQLEASRVLGHTTSQYISNFERGLCEPSVETALKLSEVYGFGKRELFDLMVKIYAEDLNEKLFSRSSKSKRSR